MADGTAERRFVEIGGRYGSSMIIDQGLEAGDLVIVEGMHKIQHGQAVDIVDEPSPEGAPIPAPEESAS